MSKPVIGFCIRLLVALSVVLSIHVSILYLYNFPIFNNLIIYSYVINYVLAVLIFDVLYKLRIKYLDLLGFIYMGGSFLKFGIYFLFFNPVFKQNGTVSNLEAASFLAPYLLCLIIETFYLIKLLNNKL